MDQISFPQIVDRGSVLDVHKEAIVATIRGSGLEEETRTLGTFTGNHELFRDWLKSHSVTHLAMESTGVYWKPVFNILESTSRFCWSMPGTLSMFLATRLTRKIARGLLSFC